MSWNWKYRGKEYKGNQRNDRWTIVKEDPIIKELTVDMKEDRKWCLNRDKIIHLLLEKFV
jgi:hypothetical protein